MPRALRRFGTKTFITTVDLRLLRALLERHAAYLGEVLDYFTCRSEATTRNVLLAYFGNDQEAVPGGLLDDVHRMSRLSTETGARVLRALAHTAGVALVPPEPWSHAERARATPRHLALTALIDHPDLFAQALMRMPFRTADRPAEFIGEDDHTSVDLVARLDALGDVARGHYRALYQGDTCTVDAYEEDGAVHVLLGHGRTPRTQVVVDEEDDDARPLGARDMAHDALVFVPETGRLLVTARTSAERQTLADVFARVVLRRPAFFQHAGSQAVFTPRPVIDAGAAFQMRPRHQDIAAAFLTYVHISERRTSRSQPVWGFGVSDPTNAVRRLHEQCPRVRLDEMDVDQLDFVFVFHDRRQPDGPRRRRAVTLQFPNVLVYDRTAITTDAIQQELYAHGFYHDTRHAAVPHDLFA